MEVASLRWMPSTPAQPHTGKCTEGKRNGQRRGDIHTVMKTGDHTHAHARAHPLPTVIRPQTCVPPPWQAPSGGVRQHAPDRAMRSLPARSTRWILLVRVRVSVGPIPRRWDLSWKPQPFSRPSSLLIIGPTAIPRSQDDAGWTVQ